MAKVTIGGEEIEVDLPTFKKLKAAWLYIAVVQGSTDPMAGVDAILGLISVGKVGEAVSVDQLEERMKPSEMKTLRPFVNELLIEIGLVPKPGEAAPAGEVNDPSPSPATSTASLPNSSPPDAETGTE